MRRLRLAAVGLGVLLVIAGLAFRYHQHSALGSVKRRLRQAYDLVTVTERCVRGPLGVRACVASDMAKLPNHGLVPLERWLFDPDSATVHLVAARNEAVAFQLVLKGGDLERPVRARVDLRELRSPTGAVLPVEGHMSRYLAHYAWVEPGGHTWGPRSDVLPWPDFYPDALIPFETRCRLAPDGLTGPQTVIESFPLPPPNGQNQALWIDIYVPPDQPDGLYRGALIARIADQPLHLNVELDVLRARLPDSNGIDAVGEVYDPYRSEGIGAQMSDPAWQRMAQCYQQLAHRHRVVFVERVDDVPSWSAFDAAYSGALSGELFTAVRGYVGPGAGTAVAVWRAPWPQPYNGELRGPLAPDQLARYRERAAELVAHMDARGWSPYLFAYIFDEVDGPTDEGAEAAGAADRGPRYLKMVHDQMRRVQAAIDAGAGPGRVNLMWTSHADAAQWEGVAGLDLAGSVRLWAPNAHAASPGFLQRRSRLGERIWFYHSGHPSIGLHVINASGIEMRTWGVISARYSFDGHFMWAVNLSDPEHPYATPSYKGDDDRFGNGCVVYPGAKLPNIGWPAIAEPVPSMRLKAWRRGLQDAELARLARAAGHGPEVERLLRDIVPRALGEARRGEPSWPSDPERWARFRLELLRLASSPPGAAEPARGGATIE